MLSVYICVSSSCHIKGSHYLVRRFGELIKKYGLENRVELKSTFCLNCCTNGMAIRVGDDIIGNITVSNCDRVFEERILSRVNSEEEEAAASHEGPHHG